MAYEISSSERGPDWANLLPEILALIAKRIAAIDYLNFSAVCTSWASIASQGYGMPPLLPLRKPHPFLLMRGDDGEQSESITLLDIFDNPRRSYKIEHLPEIGGKLFVGSQFGWVALLDEFSNPSLRNLFTRALIELPPITTLPNVKPVYDSNGSISEYFYLPKKESYSLEDFQSALKIRKLVLSSDPADGNFAAAAIFGFCTLMFLRPGEKTWSYWNKQFTSVPYVELEVPYDVVEVIYREGKFLALTEPGDVYEIDPCDLSVEDRLVAKGDGRFSPLRYLVDSSGDLLNVYRIPHDVDLMSRTTEIDVKRLDTETGAWVPVPSLGDQALFTEMASPSVASVHDFTVKDARGNDVDLSIYKGKVLLIVNVASHCGLTDSNYTEMGQLYEKYKNQGMEILAFPCNQFLGQEPGSNEEIVEFVCTRFKAEYPIFDKVEVNGDNAAPIYKFLKSSKGGPSGDGIEWNFSKFLVDKDGHVVDRYAPTTPPLSIEEDVKKLLGLS